MSDYGSGYLHNADDGGSQRRVVLRTENNSVVQYESHHTGGCKLDYKQRIGPWGVHSLRKRRRTTRIHSHCSYHFKSEKMNEVPGQIRLCMM